MRRIFSIVMVLAMLLAAAAVPVSAKPYAEYPWVYEDFETDEAINAVTSNASIARSTDGAGGTKGAARITVTRDYGTAKFPFIIKNGTTYRMSAWIKMIGDVPQNSSLHFIFYMHQKLADGSPAETASCFKDIVVNDVQYSTEEYVYVTTTFTYEGTGRLNGVDVETCDGDATVELRLGNGTLATTNGNTIDYLVDDLIVEPITEEGSDPVIDTSVGFVNGNFETGFDDTAWLKQNCNVSLVDGANGTENGVMITSTGNYGQIKQRAPMEFNKTYRISLYAKAGDEATVGKELKLIIDRKDGKTDDAITTNYEYLPQSAISSNPASLILTDEWQKIELIYKNSFATFEQVKPYIYPRVGSGTELECYCLDELEIEELPDMIYNGSFESGLDGWSADGVSADISDDAPEGYSSSARITETSSYGGLKQGAAIKQGGSYRISFWAKGESWTGDGEETEIYPVLDRYASNSTDDEFYENLTLSDGTPAMLTKDWQFYEFDYVCDIDTDNYRVPIFYLQIGNGRADAVYYVTGVTITDTAEPESPEEPEEPAQNAEVLNMTVSGKPVEGHTLGLSYEIAGDIPGGLIKIMRSYNGQYVSVGSAFLDGSTVSYTPEASDAGGTIRFTALPITAENEPLTVKSVETEEITHALNIEPVFISGFGNETISAEVEIINNSRELNITAVLALFDENNTMTAMTEQSVNSVLEGTDTITLELPDNGAAKARLFVWEGSSAADTTMNSLIENVCIEK